MILTTTVPSVRMIRFFLYVQEKSKVSNTNKINRLVDTFPGMFTAEDTKDALDMINGTYNAKPARPFSVPLGQYAVLQRHNDRADDRQHEQPPVRPDIRPDSNEILHHAILCGVVPSTPWL